MNKPADDGEQTVQLSVVCPMFNEEGSIDLFLSRIVPILKRTQLRFEIVCVNDGSTDNTLSHLLKCKEQVGHLTVIDLSRRFGKEAALSCGIDHARGAAVIPIDADLQDPPELIVEMVALWRQGFDVVLAQRVDRSADNPIKRRTAEWFYRLHNGISDTPLPPNVGDFRLMDRKVVDVLKLLPERRRFMKGLFAWVGFRQATVSFVREPRSAGQSKFSGWRLWNLALEGLTSFSTVPLRVWTYIGLFVAMLAFCFGLVIVGRTLLLGSDLPGYASLVTIILFLGGVQLIGMGIIGEYLGRVYTEVKGRPLYIVREIDAHEP